MNNTLLKKYIKEIILESFDSDQRHIFYHGTPDMRTWKNGQRGIHIGTKLAATEALDAKIGIPYEGEWDGTRIYGETRIAGEKRAKELGKYVAGHTYDIFRKLGYDIDSYYPKDIPDVLPVYSNRDIIPLDCKPIIFKCKIIGPMTNSIYRPHKDAVANGMIIRNMKKGNARRGYYYMNDAEDVGSISAVVPDVSFIEILG
jgi:hypothetical protein